jgi:hypothetical protein
MILEEIIGNAVLSITKNNKVVELKVGDSFTDEEYMTRTVYGDSGKVVIRIDENCTIEIGALPAPTPEVTTPAPTPAPKTTLTTTPTPPAAE